MVAKISSTNSRGARSQSSPYAQVSSASPRSSRAISGPQPCPTRTAIVATRAKQSAAQLSDVRRERSSTGRPSGTRAGARLSMPSGIDPAGISDERSGRRRIALPHDRPPSSPRRVPTACAPPRPSGVCPTTSWTGRWPRTPHAASAITEFEAKRAEQKQLGKLVPQAQGEEKQELLARTKALSARGQGRSRRPRASPRTEWQAALLAIPNLAADEAPAGGEDDFVVLETVGTPRRVRLRAARPHRARQAARRDRHRAWRQGLGQPLLLPHRRRRPARARAGQPGDGPGLATPASPR